MSNIYRGDSESFDYIANCYEEYAREVIAARALPDMRDGLKIVQRRVLYACYSVKPKQLSKCAVVVAEGMKIHPHGDSSVWGAFTLMTDSNGSFNMPLFKGQGNLGHVWSSKPAAAYRYPKWMVHENADDFFKDKEVMKLIPSEEGDGMEPVVLLVNYPAILVNSTEGGIAVSTSTRIPNFNFGDVCNLVIKYLEKGKLDIEDTITPDFPTGGVLVKDDAELAKIMLTGKGKLKIRAKVEIDGKHIMVKEVPYGKTQQSIINAITDSDIKEISSVWSSNGYNPATEEEEMGIDIECKNKKCVEYVLMELYRRNILQTVFSSNMLVTFEGTPHILGVFKLVEKWCAWRRSVLAEKFEYQLKAIESETTLLDYFTRLILNEEWKTKYTSTMIHEGKKKAEEYLHEIFDDIPSDVCEWIGGRAISAFNNGGRYLNRYNELVETKNFYEESQRNPNGYIINELKDLLKSKAGMYERKTQVTYTDYKFSKIVDSTSVEDTSYCVWTLYRNGFLRKTREQLTGEDILCQFEGYANSILIGFDNFGRVFRLQGSEIEYTGYSENGTYLPKLLDATFQEDYKVLYLGLLDGTRRMLLYRDGYVGFFDTSEWFEKKVVKVISKGVCLAVYDKLLEVYEENEIPHYLMVADDSNDKLKLGIVNVDSLLVKSRLSRTKALDGVDIDFHYSKSFDNWLDVSEYVETPETYDGKLRVMRSNFVGDPEELQTGRYEDICLDYATDED